MTDSHLNKPNFFILGAGRSGSTYLYRLLLQHPDIFLTTPKEPNFFCRPFAPGQIIKNPLDYFELYDPVSDEAIRGEASHAYLTCPGTARVLKELFPESKFLVILRNPADRAYSLYHYMRRHGYENIKSFESALEAEDARFNSSKFRNNCLQYLYNSFYFRSGLYGEQLRRYFAIFPKQQFHIVKFEEFITNPVSHLEEIFRFLGVDQEFSPELEVGKNDGNVTSRFPGIQHHLRKRLRRFDILRNVSTRLLGSRKMLKVGPMTTIPPLPEKTKEMLLTKYSSDLHDLFDMTGISFLDEAKHEVVSGADEKVQRDTEVIGSSN